MWRSGPGSVTARAGAPLRALNVTRGTVLAADVEAADSLWAKFMGLMGRRSLDEGAGLPLSVGHADAGVREVILRIADPAS